MKNLLKLRVHLPVLFITMIALTFSGCTDMPSSSEHSEPGTLTSVINNQSFSNTANGNIPDGFKPNSQKYNDSSKPVATGKSGGVTLYARAMMNSQMKVDLEITSAELDSNGDPSGTIARVQVKALDTGNSGSNKPDWVKNYNNLNNGGSFTESYDNLLHGQQLDIQANVREMFEGKRNSARTGVVDLLETVKFRPDLAVTHIDAPAEVFVQNHAIINARVSENLGDLGARADCILRIDGNEIDRASGIWVDAGDAVVCSFQTQFEATGTKNGEVSIENVKPGDFDYGNNSSTFQIEVTESDLNDFYWDANVSMYETGQFTWGNDDLGNYFEANDIYKHQQLWIRGYTSKQIGFPLDFDVNVTSGGHSWLNESLTSVTFNHIDDDYDLSRTYLPNNSILYIYDYKDSSSVVALSRVAENVVYYGFFELTGDYHFVFHDDTIPQFGNDVTFKITLDGSVGSLTFMGEIPLNEEEGGYEDCYDWGCTTYYQHILFGTANGFPD